MTEAQLIQAAFRRAAGRTGAVHVVGVSAGGFATYSVGSSSDVDAAYRVTVRDEQYRCTCPSEVRPACWHRAAVAVRRANDRAHAAQLARQAGLLDIRTNGREVPAPPPPRRLPPRDDDQWLDARDEAARRARLAETARLWGDQ